MILILHHHVNRPGCSHARQPTSLLLLIYLHLYLYDINVAPSRGQTRLLERTTTDIFAATDISTSISTRYIILMLHHRVNRPDCSNAAIDISIYLYTLYTYIDMILILGINICY